VVWSHPILVRSRARRTESRPSGTSAAKPCGLMRPCVLRAGNPIDLMRGVGAVGGGSAQAGGRSR
jgi:hypothetical protein